MEIAAGVIIVLLIVLIGLLVYSLMRQSAAKPADTQGMMLLQGQVTALQKTVTDQLADGTAQLVQHLQTHAKASVDVISNIRDAVQRQLTEVGRNVAETKASTDNVLAITKQIADLEKVLKHQKQRGNLGERSLELILGNMLSPTQFKMQYQLPGGSDIVDAIIFAKEGNIPVDAKFPLENYLRLTDETDDDKRAEFEKAFIVDLKARIDETAKYIRPAAGTLDFAFMYIPAEAIYYDLLVNEVGAVKANTRTLIEYAYTDKRVIIVSPTTFTAYLHSVLYGFKAFQVEQAAKEISKNVELLGRHLKAYDEHFCKLGTSLSTTVNHYNNAAGELRKFDRDVLKITGERAGLDPQNVERPLAAE